MLYNGTMDKVDRMKAVFLDYTGTMIQFAGPDMEEMISTVVKNSNVGNVQEALNWWFSNLGRMEEEACHETYVNEEELCMSLLEKMAREKGLKGNLQNIKQLNVNFWMYGPLFSDVKPFFEQCMTPLYVVTNNSSEYVRICMRRNGLHVNDVISADDVKAFKPHTEIFVKALDVAGVEASEALQITDSVSDAKGAAKLGIRSLIIDRKLAMEDTEFRTISNLKEALRYL